MFPFLESIRLEQQKLHFIKEHEDRFARTQKDNWGQVIYKNLIEIIIRHPAFPADQGKYKCRIVYSPTDIQLSFLPYQPKTINKLKIVTSDLIDYPYKSTDRNELNKLTQNLAPDTEILIFKNGLLTDSSFSNVALFDGKDWFTPKQPLLAGVHRAHLIENGLLGQRDITRMDLKHFQTVRLINAMLDWEHTWELPLTPFNQLDPF